MNFHMRDASEARVAVAAADTTKPHRLLWPGFIIAFAMVVTLLWIGTLFWLSSRMLFLMFFN